MKNNLLLILVAFCLSTCVGNADSDSLFTGKALAYHEPNHYLCPKINDIVIDGVLDDENWSKAKWSQQFKDIQGEDFPAPKHTTRVKMTWNDQYLFIAAEIAEPHVWASITERDAVIFYDNDFEVFIDPNSDTHHYSELEVNAFATAWDLLLTMPYRDFGYAIDDWDIKGLKVGVNIQGTINDPSDVDQGWTVEIAIPFSSLVECGNFNDVPLTGDYWRINFSRVEWRTEIKDGQYVKQLNPETGKAYPEDNWVWSPQYHINMHMPEYWGYVVFTELSDEKDEKSWSLPVDEKTKWHLRNVYYLQQAYRSQYDNYAKTISELGWSSQENSTEIPTPEMQSTWSGYNALLPALSGQGYWMINEKGFIRQLKNKDE